MSTDPGDQLINPEPTPDSDDPSQESLFAGWTPHDLTVRSRALTPDDVEFMHRQTDDLLAHDSEVKPRARSTVNETGHEALPLFDAARSAEARDEAIDRVEENADARWKDDAYVALQRVAGRMEELTTDDVWREVGYGHGEPRAMGAVMRRGARDAICAATDRTVKSVRVACHRRPLTVWRSLKWSR